MPKRDTSKQRTLKRNTRKCQIITVVLYFKRRCPRGVMVKADGLRNRSEWVRTPVALFRSLSDKYPLERYEPPYPPSYGLNSVVYSYADACKRHNKDERHSLLEKYTSLFIWKGCVWEGVGDRTELQHIDPHSYGHQRFFPVLLGCSTGDLGPSLPGCWLSLPHLISNWSGLQTALSYIIVQRSLSCGRHKLHSFNLSTVKVIISWSTNGTCYLQRCISYFDSPAGL